MHLGESIGQTEEHRKRSHDMEQLKPVVLIVEDEFLLRMDSAAVMEEAGFEVVQAGNADEAIAILGMRSDIEVVFTDIQMPGSIRACSVCRGSLAADQNRRNVGPCGCRRRRPARRRRVHLQALQRGRDCRDAPEPDWPRVNCRSLRSSPLGFFRRRVCSGATYREGRG